jgi:hypothetical protein
MIEVVRFQAKHMAQIEDQEINAYLRPFITGAHIRALEEAQHSFTGLSNGRAVVCAGVTEYWPNRGEAWAILDLSCKKEFLGIHHAVRNFLNTYPLRRIEAAVDVGFEAGHRWAKALGFQLEASRLRAYRPDGGDCSLYARVK